MIFVLISLYFTGWAYAHANKLQAVRFLPFIIDYFLNGCKKVYPIVAFSKHELPTAKKTTRDKIESQNDHVFAIIANNGGWRNRCSDVVHNELDRVQSVVIGHRANDAWE